MSLQQQWMAERQNMQNLIARASDLKNRCDALERTRPPGALSQPLPAR